MSVHLKDLKKYVFKWFEKNSRPPAYELQTDGMCYQTLLTLFQYQSNQLTTRVVSEHI